MCALLVIFFAVWWVGTALWWHITGQKVVHAFLPSASNHDDDDACWLQEVTDQEPGDRS